MYKKRIWLDGESIFTALSMNNIEDGIEKMSTDLAGLRVPTVDKSNFVSALKLGEKADIDHSHKDYAAVGHTHSFYQLLDKIDVPNPVLLVPVVEMDNYYTKTQTYSKSEVDSKILAAVTGGTVDLSVYYSREEFDVIYVNIRKMIDGLATLSQSNAYIKLVDVYGKAVIDTKIVELTEKVQGYLKEYETKDQLFTRKEIDDMLDTIDITTNDYVAVIELSSYADLKHTYNKTYIDNSLDEKADTNHVGEHTAHYITQDDLKLKSDKGHRETPARIVFDDGDSLEEKYLKGTLVGGTKLETHVVDLFGDIKNVIEETIFGDTVQTKGFRQLGLGAAKYRVLEIEELDTFRDQHGVKINYMGEIQITDTKKLRVIPDGGRLNPLQLGLRSFLLGYDSSILLQSTINRATYDNSIVDLSMCELTVHDIVVTDHTSIDGCNTGKIYLMKGFNNILKAGHRVDQEKGIDSSYIMNLELIGTRGIHGKTDATNECGLYVYRGTRNKVRNCIFTGFNGAGAVLEEGVNLEGTRFIECVFQDSVFGVVTKDQSIYNRVEQCTFADVDHGMIIATTGNVIDGCNLKNTDISVYGNIEFGMFLNTGYSFNSVDSKCTFRYVPHAENPSTMLFQGLSRIPNMITKARPGTVFSGVHFENIAHIGADNQAVIANSFTTVDSPKGASEIFASVGFVDGAAEKDDINMDEVFASVPKRPSFSGIYKYDNPVEFDFDNNSLIAKDEYDFIDKSNGDFMPEFDGGSLVIKREDMFMFNNGIHIDASKDKHVLEIDLQLDPTEDIADFSLLGSILTNTDLFKVREYKPFIMPNCTSEQTRNYIWLGVDERGRRTLFGIGENSVGQLGLGHNKQMMSATKIPFENADKVVSIAIGKDFSAIVLDDGSVYTCGDNTHGQLALGHKNRMMVLTKTDTSMVNGKPIQCYADNYCGIYILTDSNKAYSSGRNDNGALGVGLPAGSSNFVTEWTEMQGIEVGKKVVKMFPVHIMGILTYDDGTVGSWGYNGGNTGLRSGGDTTSVVTCTGLSGWNNILDEGGVKDYIRNSRYGAMLLTNANNIYSIGSNDCGQAGLPNPSFGGSTVALTNVYLGDILSEGEHPIKLFSHGGALSGFVSNKGNIFVTGMLHHGIMNKAQDKEMRDKYLSYGMSDRFIKVTSDDHNLPLPIKHVSPFLYGVIVVDADDDMHFYGTTSIGDTVSTGYKTPTEFVPNGVDPADVLRVWSFGTHSQFVATKDKIYARGCSPISIGRNRYYSDIWMKNPPQDIATIVFGAWVDCEVDFDPSKIYKTTGTEGGGGCILLDDGDVYEFSSASFRSIRMRHDADGKFFRKAITLSPTKTYSVPELEFSPKDLTHLNNSIGSKRLASSYGQQGIFGANGRLYGFGLNQYNNIGITDNYSTNFIREIKYDFGGPITHIVSEENSSMFLRDDGKIFFIGLGGDYRFGNDTTAAFKDMQELRYEFPSKVVKINGDSFAKVFMLEDGSIYVCGRNTYGKLGLGHESTVRIPTELTFFKENNLVVRDVICAHHQFFYLTDSGIYRCGMSSYVGSSSNITTPVLFMDTPYSNIEIFVNIESTWLIKLSNQTSYGILGTGATYIVDGTGSANDVSPTVKWIDEIFDGIKVKEVHLLSRAAILIKSDNNKYFGYGNRRRNTMFDGHGDGDAFVRKYDITNRWPISVENDIEIIHVSVKTFTNHIVWDKTADKVFSFGNYWGDSYLQIPGGCNGDHYSTEFQRVLVMEKANQLVETPSKIIDIIGPNTREMSAGYTFLMEDGGILKCGGANTEMLVDPADNSKIRYKTPYNELFYLQDAGYEEGRKITSGVYSKSLTLVLSDNMGDLYMCGYSYANQLGTTMNYTPSLWRYTDARVAGKVKCLPASLNSTGRALRRNTNSYSSLVVELIDGTFYTFGVVYHTFPNCGEGQYMSNFKLPRDMKVKDMLMQEVNTYILDTDGSIWVCGEGSRGQYGEISVGNFAQFVKLKNIFDEPVDEIYGFGVYAFIARTRSNKWVVVGTTLMYNMLFGNHIDGLETKQRNNTSLSIDYCGTSAKMTSTIDLSKLKQKITPVKLHYDVIGSSVSIDIDDVHEVVSYDGGFEVVKVDMLVNRNLAGKIDRLKYTTNRGE